MVARDAKHGNAVQQQNGVGGRLTQNTVIRSPSPVVRRPSTGHSPPRNPPTTTTTSVAKTAVTTTTVTKQPSPAPARRPSETGRNSNNSSSSSNVAHSPFTPPRRPSASGGSVVSLHHHQGSPGGRDNLRPVGGTTKRTTTTNHEAASSVSSCNNKSNNNFTPASSQSSLLPQQHQQQQMESTHVWVRTDLIEALVKYQGELPKGWKPRKRARSIDGHDWGWCRARLYTNNSNNNNGTYGGGNFKSLDHSDHGAGVAATTATGTASSANSKQPFQSVKLRKVHAPVPATASLAKTAAAAPSWRGSPDRKTSSVSVTLTVDDEEFAPVDWQQQQVTVSYKYNPADVSLICTANAWWRRRGFDQHRHDDDDSAAAAAAEPPQDLTQLEQLHEPAVVYCLQRRYEWDKIYTYTGKILLALNPFRILDNVYEYNIMEQYWQQPPPPSSYGKHDAEANGGEDDGEDENTVQRPPPHIYAIAADAYRSMMRAANAAVVKKQRVDRPQQQSSQPPTQNQSILVSGESGAGKTVTTKIIMRYLATLSQRSHAAGGQEQRANIESQVLQSNPILESFGNARTVRNDNSSRFGKFIEIQFHPSGCLVSASIETYLLEKVRLIFQAPGERNYHIFYELLAGLSSRERTDLQLGRMTAHDFRMTAISGTFDRRDGVDDRDSYRELRDALDTVGFSRQEQTDLFTVASAVLHASNLTFCHPREYESNDDRNHQRHHHGDDDASALDVSNPSLRAAVELLGVRVGDLNEALCRVAIEARGEILYKNMSVQQAQKATEALIKMTYGALFTYIVRRVNGSIDTRAASPATGAAPYDLDAQQPLPTASIGVLDIFGFESFDVNSFEQLCINYCNEALQQQFNRFVFKLEQLEYQREGIEWSFISFPDNQDVLDLIEKKHEGILSVLDEQCRLPRCTDSSFARSIYEKCGDHPRFEATRTQQGEMTFSIQHYAGLVQYDTNGFLEKNKDELPKETIDLLKSSTNSFIAQLGFELDEAGSPSSTSATSRTPASQKKVLNRASSSLMRESVGSQFSSQLRELRTRIETTEPHYVRCLKPNDDLVPHQFNALVIADQLRCAGVLEAIRVSRVGFPHRYYHDHFVQRYFVLGKAALARTVRNCSTTSEVCEALVEFLVPKLAYELGGEGDLFTPATRAGRE